jgi:two-component system cell cycle response regulator
VGDRILQRLSRLLQNSVRQVDLIARYGGEEFALILPGTDKESAKKVGEKLRKQVEQSTFPLNEKIPSQKITLSIGIASVPMDTQEEKAIIRIADKALYEAKKRGRNCTVALASKKK